MSSVIYTITLNPALDRTLWVSEIKEDVSNRIIREESYAGGKGIDVSKVLTALASRTGPRLRRAALRAASWRPS
jgi:fructose-1-phosphate kinase PfkB-like protein